MARYIFSFRLLRWANVALSLLISLAFVALLIRSCFARDQIFAVTRSGRIISIESNARALQFTLFDDSHGAAEVTWLSCPAGSADPSSVLGPVIYSSAGDFAMDVQKWGFVLSRGLARFAGIARTPKTFWEMRAPYPPTGGDPPPHPYLFVKIPLWTLAAVLALPLISFVPALRRGWRRRSRARLGLCPACGYDLRSGHELCPECGTPAPQSAAT